MEGGGGEEGRRLSVPSHHPNSTTNRFLSVLDPHPKTSPSPDAHDFLELDESDVVWSPLPSESDGSLPSPSVTKSPISPSPGRGGYHRRHPQQRPYELGRSGLSAALAEEPRGFVQQRKPGVDPSISAARAMPVLIRSGSGMEASGVRSESGRLWQMSAPVKVPVWREREKKRFDGVGGRYRTDDVGTHGVAEEEEEEEQVEMVPPHVMVARSQVTTFSVFEGVGRTLKGRDLRRVRNAVLQQTGFLD